MQARYPFVTRMAIRLYEAGRLSNVVALDVEPIYGFVTRLTYRNGAVRVTRSGDVGMNSGAASDTAKDKAYTKFLLETDGIVVPEGRTFLLDWWAGKLADYRTRHGLPPFAAPAEAVEYAETVIGYPCYLKPVGGSQGVNVWCCRDAAEITEAIAELEAAHTKVMVVEKAVLQRDFRIVLLDGEVISAYERVPLKLVGDGRRTIAELLQDLQRQFELDDRDTRIKLDDPRMTNRLRHDNLTWESIPAAGGTVQLRDISNLSAGGTAVDHTTSVAPRWKEIAVRSARALGLTFCGVDLACDDIRQESGSYVVFEVNAAPGLDHYGSVGREQELLVEQLYARVLNVPPAQGARLVAQPPAG